MKKSRLMPAPRIRVKISAYDHKIIDAATKTIIDTAERNNAVVVGASAASDREEQV